MVEQIGNITLDYKYYPGKDLYCDGVVEDELLEIVKNHKPEEFQQIIEERASWPVLYHLSSLRENIVDWVPVESTMKVLEVGSGCGAITGNLAKKAGTLTCIDLSKKRSHINAYRHKECDNVTIHVGNFKDIEPELACDYDYIFLIGVFEYGQGYMGTQTPYEDFLRIIKKHLAPKGRIVIAIENKYGLKYWAGCKEDHLGTFFTGIEDYPNGGGVRTFTRVGLEKIMEANEINQYSFYYPYPDYKFMSAVYSDEYLPKVGELSTNIRNFDRDRWYLFDEKNVFDGIIKEGLFPLYSNSYALIIGPSLDIKYSKFSNDRADEFCIRTDIGMNNKTPLVKKVPLTKAAKTHVNHMITSYELLKKKYEESALELNEVEEGEDGLIFPFLAGNTLEEMLDSFLDQEDQSGFDELIKQYMDMVDHKPEMEVADYDLIFSNIIVDPITKIWSIIDYEWTFERSISTKDLTYRAFYCYQLGAQKRRKIEEARILTLIGITKEDARRIQEEEQEFQAFVRGNRCSLSQIRDKIGYEIISPEPLIAKNADDIHKKRVQIYEDNGAGYSEDTAYFVENPYVGEHHLSFVLTVTDEIKSIRIDPAMDSCIVVLESIMFNGEPLLLKGKKCMINGTKVSETVFAFATVDPNINIDLTGIKKEKTNRLVVNMEVNRVSTSLAEQMPSGKGSFHMPF